MRILSLLFAAAPFGLALVRALQRGHDLRLLWMALASFIGTAAVTAITKARRRTSALVVASSAAAFAVATVCAGTAELLLGAKAAPGIWAVTSVFGMCCAISRTFDILSRPRSI